MPQGPGDDLFLTVFADVHYYFGPPHEKPPHHRFDKGSYVYLYRDTAVNQGRLEVANQAGTPQQDAVSGSLELTHSEYSHKHPNLVTLTVDGPTSSRHAAATLPPGDLRQWHLPALDARNEKRYMFRLHTIDFYFWTTDDALLFIKSVASSLPPAQVAIRDAQPPPSAHADMMSPVVQMLEHAAISDTAYGRREPDSFTPTSTHLPSPPQPDYTEPKDRSGATELPAEYAPMAYNPAAPAAPEPIAPRQKTPPPPEAEGGTGLAAAAALDHQALQFASPPTQSFPQMQQPGSLPRQTTAPLLPASNAFPHTPQASPPTFGPPPTLPRANTMSSPGAHPGALPGQQYISTPISLPPAEPASRLPSQVAAHPTSPPPGSQPPGQGPAGGYSTYQYGQPRKAPTDPYALHSQVYRPTEAEVKTAKKSHAAGAPPTKLENQMSKVDKGMGKLFKKLEKRVG
ncbi:MAG: hypothetical protein M1838_001851 [Thelocarpon superellum]|nr:MAG: hypothetical protein M1838_001851 [Thelocarpon superellum]